MKLKRFLVELILFSILLLTISCTPTLKLGEGTNDTVSRMHLFFESNKGDSILYYQGYSVIFSYTYNLPRYIFNYLTVDQITLDSTKFAAKRSNSYYPTTLPNGTQSANNEDYYKSGYDRGHMIPAGDFAWNQVLKNETFFYTNINPQSAVLNRGIWANLEKRIREKVLKRSKDANIVTGAVFSPGCEERIGPDSLCVPVAFFKVVYFEVDTVMYSFLFDNTVDSYEGDITDFQVTVDFIEQITGEDFFDLLDDKKEAEMESLIINFNDN